MPWFEGVFGHHGVSTAGLAGYRRLGAQVLDLQTAVPGPGGKARAYFYVARGLQLFADKLVEDAFADETRPGPLPQVTVAQAEALYQQIPDLLTAAKQESLVPGGPRDVALPVLLHGRVATGAAIPVSHLAGMLRGVRAVGELAEGEILPAGDEAARAKALLAEATTDRDSASLLVGGLVQANLPPESAHQAADLLWAALAYFLGALQELALPGVLGERDLDEEIEGGSRNRTEPASGAGLSGFERRLRDLAAREMAEAERERMRAEWRALGEREHHEHHGDGHHHHHHHDWD